MSNKTSQIDASATQLTKTPVTQRTLRSYFEKKQNLSTGTINCPACQMCVTSKEFSWHKDFYCKYATSKICKKSSSECLDKFRSKARKKKRKMVNDKKKKVLPNSNACSAEDKSDTDSDVIILESSDDEESKIKLHTNEKQLFSLKDCRISLSRKYAASSTEAPHECSLMKTTAKHLDTKATNEHSFAQSADNDSGKQMAKLSSVSENCSQSVQLLLQDWSSPESSLSNCESKKFSDKYQTTDSIHNLTRKFGTASCSSADGGTAYLSNGPDTTTTSEDEFEEDKTIYRSPPKRSPNPKLAKNPLSDKKVNKMDKQLIKGSIIPDNSKDNGSIYVRKIEDFTPIKSQTDADISNKSWHTPINPDMLVTPERTPTPSPYKQESTISPSDVYKVSPALLRNPHSYGLKVNLHKVLDNKEVSVKEDNTNHQALSTCDKVVGSSGNKAASAQSPYKKRFNSRIQRALFSPNVQSSATVEVSPDGKTLDLSVGNKSPSKFRNSKCYYLENFMFVIDSVRSQPEDMKLLNEKDLEILQNFQALTLLAQKLYVRLFQRKIKWIRLDKLEYNEICDKADTYLYVSELVNCQFFFCEDALTELDEMLCLLGGGEVKNICRNIKVPCIGNKNDSIKKIMKFSRQQKSIVSSFLNCGNTSENNIIKSVKNLLGKCCIINREVRNTFMRMFMLFSPLTLEDDEEGGQQSQLLNLLMVGLGKRVFATYEVIRRHALYRTREDLLRMEKCHQFFCDAVEKTELHKWEEAEIVCKEALDYYHELTKDEKLMKHDLSLPGFLRRFTPVSLLIRVITIAIEVYQRLKRYKKAVQLLEELLSQNTHMQDCRGRWFDRLALNLDQHLKNPQKSLTVIKTALEDPEVRVGHRLALSHRAERLLASKRTKSFSQDFDGQFCLMVCEDAPKVFIQGKSLPADIPGFKRIFINTYSDGHNEERMTVSSVEELALAYYRTQGYPEGLHCEGRIAHALFGLYFWDIIYSPIPDAFRSPYQAVPFDLNSPHFYEARLQAFEERLEKLENSSLLEIGEAMEKVWIDNEGNTSIVDWKIFRSIDYLKGLVASLGPNVIAGICKRLAQDYRFTRSGFPDLIVWNPDQKTSRIVEVKGPNDRLSTKQMLWLDYLLKTGAVAEVCHVEAVGARRMTDLKSRRTSSRIANMDEVKDSCEGKLPDSEEEFTVNPKSSRASQSASQPRSRKRKATEVKEKKQLKRK